MMKADIYQTQKSNTYLLVSHGAQLLDVPSDVIQSLGTLRLLKTVDLNHPNGIGAASFEVQSDLQIHGYSVRQMEITFNESA
jgi:uncharacterized protein YcgL (UPF0745 family)